MALTTKDLIKLEELIQRLVGKRLEKLEKGQKKIKEDIIELKDGQSKIRHELDTEHEVRRVKIEKNTKRIIKIEKYIGIATR